MAEDTQHITLTDSALNKKKWRNRRAMAWVSLISMIILTYLILFSNIVPNERLKILSDVITWFYFSCISIVGAYMGVTTWASVKGA